MANIEEKILFTLPGEVRNVYQDDDNKTVVNIWLSPEQETAINNIIEGQKLRCTNGNTPVKIDEDSDKPYLKTKTNFKFFQSGVPSGFLVSDIGAGSSVRLSVELKEYEYRKRYGVSAYLRGLEVLEFIEKEEEDPFNVNDLLCLIENCDPE